MSHDTDQTLKARVYRVVNGNRHKTPQQIMQAVMVSFPRERIETLCAVIDVIIAEEVQS